MTHHRCVPCYQRNTLLRSAQVWNLTNCKLRHNLAGHTGYINTVTVSPDGSLCASGGKVRLLASLGRCLSQAIVQLLVQQDSQLRRLLTINISASGSRLRMDMEIGSYAELQPASMACWDARANAVTVVSILRCPIMY